MNLAAVSTAVHAHLVVSHLSSVVAAIVAWEKYGKDFLSSTLGQAALNWAENDPKYGPYVRAAIAGIEAAEAAKNAPPPKP